MKSSFHLYWQLELLYRLRALVDETHRDSWLALSDKLRERADTEIESYILECYDGPSETVH